MTIWREPEAETESYPGLWVHDGRVTGSITLGRSRLPLWSVVGTLFEEGWPGVERGWEPPEGTRAAAQEFVYDLLEQRGEFARLLCALAKAHRIEGERDEAGEWRDVWWEMDDLRPEVVSALKRCLDALERPTP